jgi:hypothetical protein
MIEQGEMYGTYRNGTLYQRDTGPEGIVIFHEAGRLLFKVTVENDEQHKFQQTDEELISGIISSERIDEAFRDDEINPNAEDLG